jgi:hypothetical protein
MVDSYDRHWPVEIPLYVYYEGTRPEPDRARIYYRDFASCCPDLIAFKERHRDDAAAHGREDRGPLPLSMRRVVAKMLSAGERLRSGGWIGGRARTRARKRVGMGYRWDAVRFAHKTYCVFHALATIDCDAAFWIDADTVTFADIPFGFLDATLPEDAMLAYLGRPYRTSECGFVGYNRRHPRLAEFLAGWKALYDDDTLFELAEWHDSWVFDWVRAPFEHEGVAMHNLSRVLGRRSVEHPFVNGPLGAYMDHLKGDRKQAGRSRADDLGVERHEPYWTTPRPGDR